MIILTHAVMGGAVHGAFVRALTDNKKIVWWALASGVLLGALPDLAGAIGNYIFSDSWATYNEFHAGATSEILKFVPAYGIHLAVDKLLHPFPGWLYYLAAEATAWAFSGLLWWRSLKPK